MTTGGLDKLRADAVLKTVLFLEQRIAARFPDRGLCRVAHELAAQVRRVTDVSVTNRQRIATARLASRVLMVVVLVATVVAMTLAVRSAVNDGLGEGLGWVPLIESTINDIVFAAIAVYFLYSFPERVQRGRILELLHQLRSLAHIIDMHQLTKDPERLKEGFTPTSVSPDPRLDREQMEHYLEYCSELLSLVGKTAALCAEESRDGVVLDTVSTIESLTTGMSRKIWQKISLLPPA